MATQQTQVLGRALLTPAVALLFIWMIVPLAMTIYFSTLHYSLLDSEIWSFVGLENFRYFLTDPAFLTSLRNTLVLVGSILAITILLGTPLALLLDQPVLGRAVVRLIVIAPFFVMPTVSALVWKNLLMHPVSGLLAYIATSLGLAPVDWLADMPLLAIILIEAIFLLTVFAEIFVTAGGGPGLATTNIAFLIYAQALIQYDVGSASAGGLVAVIIANIVAFFLVRIIGRNLEA